MQKSRNSPSQVLVCQRGARHHYAVPRLLECAGRLAALYTDSSAHSRVGRIADQLGRCGIKLPRLQALAARRPDGVPREKIFSSDRLLFSFPRSSGELSRAYIQQGLRGAGLVYSMYGEEIGFLEWAKTQGAKLIVDVFIHPASNRIVDEEIVQATGRGSGDVEYTRRVDAHSIRTFRLADILLCPSSWVAEGVQEFAPDCVHKIRVVPYGSRLEIRSTPSSGSEPGRVLFAGRDPLRKGLHYLADAVAQARRQGLNLEVRVAGVAAEDVQWMAHAEELNCLGSLPADQMWREFRQADVFVLPSLSEGQAGVLLEAMASGCPVIATRESGIDFDPGCGITVPARNSEALAAALIEVVGDRNRREMLAKGALEQATKFSFAAWEERLIRVVDDAVAVPKECILP